MSTPRFHLWSSVGKKLLNGLTGVLLLLFIVAHLAGNLTIFFGKNALNTYAAATHTLGPILIVIELGLGAVFLLHAVSAITVWRDNRRARESRYAMKRSKGAASKQTIASRTMIVTGLVLLVLPDRAPEAVPLRARLPDRSCPATRAGVGPVPRRRRDPQAAGLGRLLRRCAWCCSASTCGTASGAPSSRSARSTRSCARSPSRPG